MEINELYRGRLIDHVQLVVRDLEASKRFYSATLNALGMSLSGEGEGFFWADELVVSSKDSDASQGKLTGPTHLAFQAKDREAVDHAYKVVLSAGGRDNGAPGLRRHYHPNYYACFVLDPDGNNIEVAFHGPAERSADAVKISF